MKCNACKQKDYPSRKSPAPGHCEACGWALRNGDAIRPAQAQIIVGQALISEAHSKIETSDAFANLRRTLFL